MAQTTVLSVFTLLYCILAICHANQTCPVWTQWMDDEKCGTLEPSSIGEFELVNQLRGPYGFCDEPTDIECALADATHTPYTKTGQVSLLCDLQSGFMCFHSQQTGDCFNYAIRLLCPEPLKEDSKHACVQNNGLSFEFTCTFLDGWNDDLGNKSSCQHSNAIVDISDVIYGIFKASSVADVVDCIQRPLLRKAYGCDSAMVVKITVAFSEDAGLTEDDVITAFTEAAIRRNQDASIELRVDTNSASAIKVNTNQSVTSSSSNTGTIALVVSLVVFILIAALAGIIVSNFYCRRKLQDKADRTQDSTVDPIENDCEHYTSMSPRVESESMYMKLSKKTTLEVSREFLCLKETLGEGFFGKVVKAEAWNIVDRQGVTHVAVKLLKEYSLDVEKTNFMNELDLLKSIGAHPHIVSLLGCCTGYEPFYIILEFMEGGNLQDFLRSNRSPQGGAYANMHSGNRTLSTTNLMTFACQVSSGMEFLSSSGCVHRDLSARKVLLDKHNVCKISNFRLARDVVDNHEYECKTKGNLPVPWMALESIRDGIFTTKSDVWSFGVVVWEIFTMGNIPYQGMSEQEVTSSLQKGYRMPKPSHCEQELYSIILSCWVEDPEKRPTFADLTAVLQKMANDEKKYIKIMDMELADDD